MRSDDLPTEELIILFATPEKYLKTLKWSKDSEEYIKELVAGNIRAFYCWLFENDYVSPPNNVCHWIQENDPEINLWRTSCHNLFYLDSDKPSDNRMKYCCYCGNKIQEEE